VRSIACKPDENCDISEVPERRCYVHDVMKNDLCSNRKNFGNYYILAEKID
jgi:hypothetical protein